MSDSGPPRWVWLIAAVWVVGGVLVGELQDPPVDWVRIAVRLALGALVAWVIVNLILSASNPSKRRDRD